MKQSTNVKLSVNYLRYLPVGAFLTMFLHVSLLVFGIDLPVFEIIVIVLGFILAYIFSRALGFCRIHRICIYYALVVMTCIWLRRFPSGENGLFGEYISAARILVFMSGCVIFVMLALKELSIIRRSHHAE